MCHITIMMSREGAMVAGRMLVVVVLRGLTNKNGLVLVYFYNDEQTYYSLESLCNN